MAKRSMIERDKKRAKLIALKYAKRQELKKVIRNLTTTEEDRLRAIKVLDKLPKNSSPIRWRLRCQLTGRPRGNYRKFRISRLCFRELALTGQIPGIIKASW